VDREFTGRNGTAILMKTKIISSIIFLLAVSLNAQSPLPDSKLTIRDDNKRHEYLLNESWDYLEMDVKTFAEAMSAKSSWQNIDLPHTWNVWDAVDATPGYRRAASWYKKDISIPVVKNNQRFILYFEGVNITSEVYINGQKAGRHVGGYVGFDIDITPYVRFGEKNTIVVRVSNAYDPAVIPSQKSDFCIYGGITRNVWLQVVPSIYVASMRISTPKVLKSSAEIQVAAEVATIPKRKSVFEIEAVVFNKDGKEVLNQSGKYSFQTSTASSILRLPVLKNPELWSPNNPYLYTMRIRLKHAGTVIDEVTDRFGCRWYEFKSHGPFFLNGERLLLRGTQRHEDSAGYADAMPDSVQRRDMAMIKEMGANFVRLAHYPQAPEVYRACDELGILVWDELPWCRGGMGGEVWKENTRRLLREQIAQNYNHPSVIIQSLGNELDWLPDYPNGDNVDSLRAMIHELDTIAKKLNPYRLTALRKFSAGADLVDVVSPSLWPGWYSGNYKGFEKAITDAREHYPFMLHIEYGGDSHVGRHSENPVTGDATWVPNGYEEHIKPQEVSNVALNSDWDENYIVNLFDWYLHISEQMDWLSGNAQWAFKDFPTPLRPENPIPYINEKGLVDRAGHPKDAYYVFKSYWTTSPLFCYIDSHTWMERNGPENIDRVVKVFSNCSEVELFLNSNSMGKQKRDIQNFPAAGLWWPIRFIEGNNSLRAVGYRDGIVVTADSLTIHYTYKKIDVADHIVLTSESMSNGKTLVIATAVDKNGNRCLDYNKRVYFSCDRVGALLENYGTSTRSSIIEMANGRAQIECRPSLEGPSVVGVLNQDFKGEYLTVGKGRTNK
jgi:beta-galactosidase